MKIFSFFITLANVILLAACNTTSNNVIDYQIVVDAGSSGSRVRVYQIDHTKSLPIINELYEASNSIALASFATNPEAAGPTAIQPLLIDAKTFLITNYPTQPNKVSANVLGTAGMRLLSESDQHNIYQSVTNSIAAENLQIGEVETISDQLEGLYSWLDVNYLQNNFNTPNSTKGIIEIGGASAQVAFSTSNTVAQTIRVELNDNVYYVYSASFLGLGQDQARGQMNSNANYNQCYPTGYNNGPIIGNYSFSVCSENYQNILLNKDHVNLSSIKSIPGFYSQEFLGLNSVYYALNFWDITSQPNQQILEQNINNTCYTNYDQLTNQYPNAFKLYNQCANATYIDKFLYTNLALNANQLTSLQNINGTSLTYTLGYVLFRGN